MFRKMSRLLVSLVMFCLCFQVLNIHASKTEDFSSEDMVPVPTGLTTVDLARNRQHISTQIVIFGNMALCSDKGMQPELQQTLMYEIWNEAHALGVYDDILNKDNLKAMLQMRLRDSYGLSSQGIDVNTLKIYGESLATLVHNHLCLIDQLRAARRQILHEKRSRFVQTRFPRLIYALRNFASPHSRKHRGFAKVLTSFQSDAHAVGLAKAIQRESFLTRMFGCFMTLTSNVSNSPVAKQYAALLIHLWQHPEEWNQPASQGTSSEEDIDLDA